MADKGKNDSKWLCDADLDHTRPDASSDLVSVARGAAATRRAHLRLLHARDSEAIEAALCKGTPLIVDLAGVEFIDSAGLRALALAGQTARALATRLLIIPSVTVARVFQISGLEAVFNLYSDPTGALAAAMRDGVG